MMAAIYAMVKTTMETTIVVSGRGGNRGDEWPLQQWQWRRRWCQWWVGGHNNASVVWWLRRRHWCDCMIVMVVIACLNNVPEEQEFIGGGRPLKIIAGADAFGCTLKDALVAQLRSANNNIQVEDIGTSKYYSIGEEVGRRVSQAANDNNSSVETRGLVACGTGVGVAIFANKFPGVYAATFRHVPAPKLPQRSSPPSSIPLSNPLAPPPAQIPGPRISIISGWIRWGNVQIGGGNQNENVDVPCFICSLAKGREDKEFTPVDVMPGGCMKILRETPTSAIVRFKAGSVEPAHHHSFGHDLVVTKGSKCVWNLSKGEKVFIKWDGHWDLLLDEDIATANAAIDG
ncbi:hypothetical protein BUALT_BualtUnG0051000 [Buddleja alternifolia]|uniref:Uncharacterized protein n=1 Tax=Buddleja alternifolia TaxID=168488 RepID=A0AAV6W4S2_9LAMI|nr:hypothetical protein BUALT_BualtUnG0051000 [Buddleja alternifolia]